MKKKKLKKALTWLDNLGLRSLCCMLIIYTLAMIPILIVGLENIPIDSTKLSMITVFKIYTALLIMAVVTAIITVFIEKVWENLKK